MERLHPGRLFLVAVASAGFGCTSAVESRVTPKQVLAEAIQESLSDSVRSQLATNWRDSIRVRAESSAVIPGLVYHWGTYRPPRSHDLIYSALAAATGEKTAELQSPSDWVEAVKRTGVLIANERQAIGACAELIRTVGPGRWLRQPPVVYLDSSSLHEPTVTLGIDRGAVVSSATSPRVQRAKDGWQVRIWAL